MIPASPEFITAMTSKFPKEVYIKLEFYDKDMKFLFPITYDVTADDLANIRVDRNSSIQRSFSFALNNFDGRYTWGSDRDIWINKRVKVSTGIKTTNGIEYVPQGVFLVTSPYDTHNRENGKKCFITGMDKAFLYTDKRGKIVNPITIASGINIATAIKTLAQENGETLFNFDSTSVVTPYKITFEADDTRWDCMKKLADFGMCDLFFDTNGYLRLKYIGNLNDLYNSPVTQIYEYNGQNGHLYGGNTRKMDETILANWVIAMGGSGSTATCRYEIKVDNTNPLWANSPYAVQEIGNVIYQHNNGNPDGLLTTVDECKWRCKFELMKRLGYSELVSMPVSLNFLNEASDIIKIIDSESGINDRYILNSFDLPLMPNLMNLECRKEVRVISDWDSL